MGVHDGAVASVTGASRGIGLGTAGKLVAEGARAVHEVNVLAAFSWTKKAVAAGLGSEAHPGSVVNIASVARPRGAGGCLPDGAARRRGYAAGASVDADSPGIPGGSTSTREESSRA